MAPKRSFIAPPAEVFWHLPNTPWPELQAADILLVHHYKSSVAWLIRFGEWLRPLNRPYSWTNHNALVETPTTIIQEVAKGSVRSPIGELDSALVAIVRIKATVAQKTAAVAFAQWTLGSEYGYFSILGDGLDDLTGLHISIATYGSMVCSAAVARAAERMGLVPDRDPLSVQPADNARYWNIGNHVATQMLALSDSPKQRSN